MLSRPQIGILASRSLSPNMEAVLCNLGEMLYNNFDFHLLTGSSFTSDNLERLFTIHRYKGHSNDPADIFFARKACKHFLYNYRPQILMNIAQPQTLGWAVATACKNNNVQSLIQMTGDSFNEAKIYKSLVRRAKSWLLFNRFAYKAYKNADHILALGNKMKSSLLEKGIYNSKIYVLPQPFNMYSFSPVSIEEKLKIKQKIGINPDRNIILFVGRLSWAKGADRLDKIIHSVGKKSDVFQFVIVGTGEYSQKLRKYPNELVYMGGKVARENIADYYKASDLLVFPSRTEGLPNVILEALASNLPIIASPVGDIPNWISNLATEPQEYIEYILSGDWKVDCIPEQLSSDNLKQEYIRLFNQIINS